MVNSNFLLKLQNSAQGQNNVCVIYSNMSYDLPTAYNFFCFPLMQIKSFYCIFADFVLLSLITLGFIYTFLRVCISQCHKRTHYG